MKHNRKILELLFFLCFIILNFVVAAYIGQYKKHNLNFWLINISYLVLYLFDFVWGIFICAIHRTGQKKVKRPQPFYLVVSLMCIVCVCCLFCFYSYQPRFFMNVFLTKTDSYIMLYAGANFMAAFYEPFRN